MSEVRVFGIRHHGPGSARSLHRELEAWRPDAVLLEGPPEADELPREGLIPPVAILVYDPENPALSAIYPFAEFSPEWVALKWASQNQATLRFIDVPTGSLDASETPLGDPMTELARHLGYEDVERFWDAVVERREAPFAAILELMAEVREGLPITSGTEVREATMRRHIKRAQKDGFQRVAVICGAFHAPALAREFTRGDEDLALTKRRKGVRATWAPWTYDRMALQSGYASGVVSPAYYETLWTQEPAQVPSTWLLRAARLMREEGLDASPASVIESVRLAEALTAMRGQRMPGLEELTEAAWSVLCGGNDVPMRLIHQRLVVGDRLGSVPEDTPQAPLQADLTAHQKRLRLKPETLERTLDLDLRRETDLERSALLHRLNLLEVDWGTLQGGKVGRGTFHEIWTVRWDADFAIRLIEAGRWGTTLESAATARVVDRARSTEDVAELSMLANEALAAALTAAIPPVMRCLENAAAVAGDLRQLLQALPPLAQILRYGDVRKTDLSAAAHVFDAIFARACVGLPGACSGLNDEAAAEILPELDAVQGVVTLLADAERQDLWYRALLQVADLDRTHGSVVGRATRHLRDAGRIPQVEVQDRLARLASPGTSPATLADWIEGFLGESGQILIHDPELLRLIDSWVTELPGQTFEDLLPLLRRTFSVFSTSERRQLAERIAEGSPTAPRPQAPPELDLARAQSVEPIVRLILGLKENA